MLGAHGALTVHWVPSIPKMWILAKVCKHIQCYRRWGYKDRQVFVLKEENTLYSSRFHGALEGDSWLS